MLRAILITGNAEESGRIQRAFQDRAVPVHIHTTVDRLTASEVLDRGLRLCQPEVAFVSFASQARGLAITRHLEAQKLGIAIVAVHPAPEQDGQGPSQNAILEGLRAGAKEFLVAPFSDVDLVLKRIARHLVENPPVYPTFQPIYSFLPAKPGVGASTLAVNLAFALARLSEQGPIMLGDLDLNSGMLQFLLRLRNTHSVAEALEYDDIGDAGLWPHLVSRCGENLDVLHSGAVNPNIYIDPSKLDRLLDHAERSYVATCVDLSANLEQYALGALERSRRIFLVTTPDMGALGAAQGKAEFLRSAGLEARVQILLNRAGSIPGVDDAVVEETTGFPVAYRFANDYLAVNQAIEQGSVLSASSPFGQQCRNVAGHLLNLKLEETPAPKHKLLGFLDAAFGRKQPQAAQ